MRLNHPKILQVGGAMVAWGVRLWMRTLDYRVAFYDPAVDPANGLCTKPKIYIFWHENILFPLYLRGHNNLAMLLSRHRDADLLSEVADRLGFAFVRGSTFKGGSTAIRELMARSRNMHLTITPDGPRGPRRVLAQGPVYLASKTGMPLVVMGFGYDRPWRTPTWDRFAVPKPHSRARAVVSSAIHIPPNLSRDGIEHYRQQMERLLNRLTCEAEAWAESGTHKENEQTLVRESSKHRVDDHHEIPKPHFSRSPSSVDRVS